MWLNGNGRHYKMIYADAHMRYSQSWVSLWPRRDSVSHGECQQVAGCSAGAAVQSRPLVEYLLSWKEEVLIGALKNNRVWYGQEKMKL